MWGSKELSRLCLGISLLVLIIVCASGADTEAGASMKNTPLTDVPNGIGTQDDPYQISKIEHLDYVRDHLDKQFILMNDLDFLSPEDYVSSENIIAWTTGEGWRPIGSKSQPFSGTFNADGYVIKSLYIDRDNSNQGLFGCTSVQCLISNGKLENVLVSGGQNTGALVGYNLGRISNFAIQGEVHGTSYVGGLVGQNQGGILTSSMAGTVIGEKRNVGGLVGYTTGGSIDESYSLVTVQGVGSVGGLVGNHTASTTSNSYAIGDISAEKEYEYVGGLVGLASKGRIFDCYAVGTITGYGNTGGLVGYCTNSPEIINSHYDSTVSGYSDIGKGEPRTTAEMKSPETFTDWGLAGKNAIWGITNTPTYYSYPYLINNTQHPYPGYTFRDPKMITAFDFNQLTPAVSGIIDQDNKNIILLVPYGTDVNNLVPTIAYTGQAISPDTEEAQDFCDQVLYTVKAEDQSEQTYTVTVTIKERDPIITSINGVDSITVAYGSSSTDAIAALPVKTTISDSNGDAHQVNLTWVLNNFDGYIPGEYQAKGAFLLPTGVEQAEPPIDLQVVAFVRVEPQPEVPYTPPPAGSSRQGGGSSTAKETTSTTMTQTSTIIKTWVQLSSWIILQAPFMISL